MGGGTTGEWTEARPLETGIAAKLQSFSTMFCVSEDLSKSTPHKRQTGRRAANCSVFRSEAFGLI